jgi:acyl transferase domain-containing protein
MKPAQKPFKRALVSVQLDPPRIPLLSGVNNQYVAEPEIIRALLSEQLAQPVRFVDQIERLISDGVTLFVECGPDRVLSRLTRRIVGDRDITVLAADVRSRQPASSSTAYRLASLQAGLEVAGAIGVEAEPHSSHLMQKESGVSQQGETLSQPENGPAVNRDLKEVEGCIELCGSRYDIGVEHGRILSAAIKKTLEHIVDLPPQERARLPRPEAIIDSYENDDDT